MPFAVEWLVAVQFAQPLWRVGHSKAASSLFTPGHHEGAGDRKESGSCQAFWPI